MTGDTERLIRRLAANIEPVRPLPRPWIRTAGWLALSAPYIAYVLFVISRRKGLSPELSQPRFLIEQGAALATGIAAAAAAFASVVPGHNRKFLALPLLPLAIWLGSLGQGCLQDWLQLGAYGLALRPDWYCLKAIARFGAVPALVMVVMLRRGAPLTPHLTMALGGLAAAGLGNFVLRFVHRPDASVMVLVWQFGAVCVLSALAAAAGRYLLNWRSVAGGGHRGAAIG